MAHTDQAWDWGVEFRDEERAELDQLRETVPELRTELDRIDEALKISRHRHRAASQALRELAEAKPWRRRRVLSGLRERRLL
jgi:transcription initiation factor TFIIIB Brf1 subunit/transcription initiation factor TFIIB